MIFKRSIAALAALAAAVAAPAAVASGSGAGRTTTVTLKHISFIRPTVHINKGDSVKWVWKDPTVPHNVTFAHMHSGTKQKGTYTLRFTTAGTFRYHCTIHPGMDGRVIVR
jgi:plastocyanin